MNSHTITATAKRNLIVKVRAYPIEFFLGSLLSCFYLVLGSYFIYVIVFKKNVSLEFVSYTGISDYMSFIIIGGIIYSFTLGTLLNVSRSLITEMREGTLDSLLISPLNPIQYLVGNMLEQTITTIGEVIIILLISLPFGLNLSKINIFATLLCLILSCIALFGMAILLGALMIHIRDTFVSQNTVFACISLLCGVSFPIQYLPKFLQVISYCIPVTYTLKIFRATLLLDTNINAQIHDFIMLALLALVYVVTGILLIKKVVKAAPLKQFI